MVAYTKPQKWKKEETKSLRGDSPIKLIDRQFVRWQVVRFRKARRKQDVHKLHVLSMTDDLWDKVHGLCSKTWKGCE